MKLQSSTDIRIRVNGEKLDVSEGEVFDILDADTSQISFLKLNGFKEVTELQTTDASTPKIVKAKGKKKI